MTAISRIPTLFIFAGPPGVGKTTLARLLARELGAAYLRIDAVEQALRESGRLTADLGPAGYLAAGALARENLRLGVDVVADSVNPIALTRRLWREAAADVGAAWAEIEVVCSDAAEHRRRVETRGADLPGFVLPTWREVVERPYAPWDRPHIVIDTAGRAADRSCAELLAALGAARHAPREGRPTAV